MAQGRSAQSRVFDQGSAGRVDEGGRPGVGELLAGVDGLRHRHTALLEESPGGTDAKPSQEGLAGTHILRALEQSTDAPRHAVDECAGEEEARSLVFAGRLCREPDADQHRE